MSMQFSSQKKQKLQLLKT